MRKSQISIYCHLFDSKTRQKRVGGENGLQWLCLFGFSERKCSFSLHLRAIRPSEFFGTRRKVVLCGEAYAWAPILGSFVKLREVWVSPYLCFILYLCTLLMFELNEVVRGRLISPISWDRIVIIFETQMVQPVTVYG